MTTVHKRQKTLLRFFAKPAQQASAQLARQENKQCSIPFFLGTDQLAYAAALDADILPQDSQSGAPSTGVTELQDDVQGQPAAQQSLLCEEQDSIQPDQFCLAETATGSPATASAAALAAEMSTGLTNGSSVLSAAKVPSLGPNLYEQERQERIQRNRERMQSLGLQHMAQVVKPAKSVAAPTAKAKRPAAKTKAALPQRSYSLRTRGGMAAAAENQTEAGKLGQDDTSACEPVVEMYDDSSVISYMCQAQSPFRADQIGTNSGEVITGFAQMPGQLSDPKLIRAYSLDVHGTLLAAGGKNGHAAVFGIGQAMAGQEVEVMPLLSAKLHKSWIADVQLVPLDAAVQQQQSIVGNSNAGQLPWLLTASNDGSVSIWDLSKCFEGRPLQVTTESLHAGGIWSMHYMAGNIATASKDCSMAVSKLDSSGTVTLLHSYEQQHAGAVKCARWQDHQTVATCGNDMCIKVNDTRSHSCGSIIANAHDGCVNCVRWHPSNPNQLLSTGTDPHVHLWDLRCCQTPLQTFTGHTPATRCSQVYQALFVAEGGSIACGGPKSDRLSLYCCERGRTISRGDIGFEPTAMYSMGSTLFCSTAKRILIYSTKA